MLGEDCFLNGCWKRLSTFWMMCNSNYMWESTRYFSIPHTADIGRKSQRGWEQCLNVHSYVPWFDHKCAYLGLQPRPIHCQFCFCSRLGVEQSLTALKWRTRMPTYARKIFYTQHLKQTFMLIHAIRCIMLFWDKKPLFVNKNDDNSSYLAYMTNVYYILHSINWCII